MKCLLDMRMTNHTIFWFPLEMIGVHCLCTLVDSSFCDTRMVQKWTRALVLVFFILMNIWCILSLWEISLDFSSWSFCFWCGVEFAMVMSTEKNAFTFSLIARGLFFFYTGIILNLILECYSVFVSTLRVTVLLFTGYLIVRAFGEKRSPMNWLEMALPTIFLVLNQLLGYRVIL